MEISQYDVLDLGREAEALAVKLEGMYDAIVHPFPYDDIRRVYKTLTSRKITTRRAIDKGFIPDLDVYLSDVAGCCSWGKKALSWDVERRGLFRRLMRKELFDKHPEYILVRRWITQGDTPHLYQKLVSHNEMRLYVLALIRMLDQLEGR